MSTINTTIKNYFISERKKNLICYQDLFEQGFEYTCQRTEYEHADSHAD